MTNLCFFNRHCINNLYFYMLRINIFFFKNMNNFFMEETF